MIVCINAYRRNYPNYFTGRLILVSDDIKKFRFLSYKLSESSVLIASYYSNGHQTSQTNDQRVISNLDSLEGF